MALFLSRLPAAAKDGVAEQAFDTVRLRKEIPSRGIPDINSGSWGCDLLPSLQYSRLQRSRDALVVRSDSLVHDPKRCQLCFSRRRERSLYSVHYGLESPHLVYMNVGKLNFNNGLQPPEGQVGDAIVTKPVCLR